MTRSEWEDRYTRGELTEEGFERKVEDVLETEEAYGVPGRPDRETQREPEYE